VDQNFYTPIAMPLKMHGAFWSVFTAKTAEICGCGELGKLLLYH
jgi:hypothetical protein